MEDGFERLKALGRCYVNLALENHKFYEIMFIMKEPLTHIETTEECDIGWEERVDAYQFLLTTVEDCQKQYNIVFC